MKDLHESLTTDGNIQTGVRRDRVLPLFEPIINAAIQEIKQAKNDLSLQPASLYLYGSVATGMAVPPLSDIDLLTIDLQSDAAQRLAVTLTEQFSSACRSVEIAAASYKDFLGETDEPYGGRAFLRHYCVHLYGRDLTRQEQSFRGDARVARGFNGDIEYRYNKWQREIHTIAPDLLGRRVARKVLLAVAGIVSVQDRIWTTDRRSGALRWAELNPQWRPMVLKLMSLSEATEAAVPFDLDEILSAGGIVSAVVDDFRVKIGLWH